MKAAAPLSKMPAEIWRFFAGHIRSATPRPPPAPAAGQRPRLFPRRTRRRCSRGRIPGVAAHLKILIVTDAWQPQVNGVVRTLEVLGQDLRALGHDVRYATPEGRFTVPLPTYPEIRLALFPAPGLEKRDPRIRARCGAYRHRRHAGPVGARASASKHGIAFSTSFHTRFPEYVKARFPFMPEDWVYRWLRWFHGPATAMMVATPALRREMRGAWLQQSAASGRAAWMSSSSIPLPRRALPFPKARSGSMSAGWRWRRISRPSWRWTCPAPSWWWATARPRGAGSEISGGEVPGRPIRRGAGAGLCRQRRLCLSQPHRHLRAGAAGGPGLRHCRWRPIRCKARWTWSAMPRRRAGHRPARRLPAGARTSPAKTAAPSRSPAPGGPVPSSSSRTCLYRPPLEG